MTRYEYKVVPAPTRGIKARTAKTAESRFALGVETVLNEMGAQGWEFQRAELLPSDERSGLTGTTVHWRNLLVFRRAVAAEETPVTGDQPADRVPPLVLEPAPQDQPQVPFVRSGKPANPPVDNGVEETGDIAEVPSALRTRATQQLTLVAERRPPVDPKAQD